MIMATRTSDLRANKGLVDFIAYGEIIEDGERIPCEIGYNAYPSYDDDEDEILRADYIFIKSDGVTEGGKHYFKKTINLKDNACILVLDEEA